MNKKGFTLIELLAVIVILAIIALIATPIVLNIIEDSKKSAFVQTGNGIVDAAEYYYLNKMSDGVKPTEDIIIDLPTSDELEFDGENPKDGLVIISTEGKVAIGITNGKYCITKGFEDTGVTVTEDVENCKNPEQPITLASLATTGMFTRVDGSDESEIKEVNGCAFDKTEGACAPGTEFAIQVNEKDKYRFYVLKDDGDKVTLILDRNLGDNVAWYATNADNSFGPITALTVLQERTNTWTNLPKMTISEYYESDEIVPLGNNKTFSMYARLLYNYGEIGYLSDYTVYQHGLPEWLYINLKDTGDDTDSKGNNKMGYWTMEADTSDLSWALGVSYEDYNGLYTGIYHDVEDSSYYGVRPVIELYK